LDPLVSQKEKELKSAQVRALNVKKEITRLRHTLE
jgi:hypothetical protein